MILKRFLYVVAELLTEPRSGESLFYKQLGDDDTMSVFSKYLTMFREYSFKHEPDHKDLAKLLDNLVVLFHKATSCGQQRLTR